MCMSPKHGLACRDEPFKRGNTLQSSTRRVWNEARRSLLTGLAIAACAFCLLALYARLMPPLSVRYPYKDLDVCKGSDWTVLRRFPPLSIGQLADQRDVVQRYVSHHPAALLAGYTMVYVFMQTFAIPGTVSLSLLSGALFGIVRGLLLVAVVSTTGSCACFMLSRLIGRGLARAIWPEQLAKYAREVDERRGDLFNYLIFLRVTPILPNIFINIASPVVDVPLRPFALATFLGCLPNNFLAVNAGSKLGTLESFADLYDYKIVLAGCVVGAVALAPMLWRRRADAKERQQAVRRSNVHQE